MKPPPIQISKFIITPVNIRKQNLRIKGSLQKDIRRQFWTGLFKVSVRRITGVIKWSFYRLTSVDYKKFRPALKKFKPTKRDMIIAFLIGLVVGMYLGNHPRIIPEPVKAIKVPKPISTLKTPDLKPQSVLEAVYVAPPAPPPATVGCGSDPYMAQIYMRESGCRTNAVNPSSGAYGLCQSLPGYKMATAGADWQTSWTTQNAWCVGYAISRYGSPAAAWAAWQVQGWW